MHPPRGGHRFSICISLPPIPTLIPCSPATTDVTSSPPLPPALSLFFSREGPWLNSQRPHWEEGVNATRMENVELTSERCAPRDSSGAFLLAEKLQFRRIYMGKPESGGSSKDVEWDVGTSRWQTVQTSNFAGSAVMYFAGEEKFARKSQSGISINLSAEIYDEK